MQFTFGSSNTDNTNITNTNSTPFSFSAPTSAIFSPLTTQTTNTFPITFVTQPQNVNSVINTFFLSQPPAFSSLSIQDRTKPQQIQPLLEGEDLDLSSDHDDEQDLMVLLEYGFSPFILFFFFGI
jgi:hypothetical protein